MAGRKVEDLVRKLDGGHFACELCGAEGTERKVAGHIANFHPGPLREAGEDPDKVLAAIEPTESKPEEPDTSEPEDFDVSDHSVEEVLAWVGDDRERAVSALGVEQEGKARVSLLDALGPIVGDYDGS